MNKQAVIHLIFFLVGVACLYGTFHFYNEQAAFLETARETSGTVIALVESCDSDGCSYAPEVSFEVDGKTYRFTSRVSSNPPSWSKGEEAPVLYNPDDPDDARINTFWSLWFVTILMGVFSAVFLLIIIRAIRQRTVPDTI